MNLTARERYTPNFYANGAVRMYFFNNKLSCDLTVSDIFKTRKLNSVVEGRGFSTVNNIKESTRILAFRMSYYFQSKEAENIEEPQAENFGDDF